MRVRRGLALVATWAAVSSTRGQGLVSITSHVFSDYNCTGLPTEYSWVAADTCLGFGSTTGSGYMYKCDANTSSLPTMHQCNVSYHSPTMNAHVLGRQELLDRSCSPTTEQERIAAKEHGYVYNATSLRKVECTTNSDPSKRYTMEDGGNTWCGYSQWDSYNCTGRLVYSKFYVYNERGEGKGRCTPQPGFEGTYWQYYYINITHGTKGALTYFWRCQDALCNINCEQAPLPSPPEAAGNRFVRPLGLCENGPPDAGGSNLHPAHGVVPGRSHVVECISEMPQETTPIATTPPPLVRPRPPRTIIDFVMLGERACLGREDVVCPGIVCTQYLCFGPQKREALVKALAEVLQINYLFIRVSKIEPASKVDWLRAVRLAQPVASTKSGSPFFPVTSRAYTTSRANICSIVLTSTKLPAAVDAIK